MGFISSRIRGRRVGLVAIVAVGLVAPAAIAGTVYTWKTSDGTVAFTDDEKRVPARYKGSVETREIGDLDTYQRFTPVGDGSTAEYADRLERRLDSLQRSEGAVRYAPVGETRSGGEGRATITVREGSRYGGSGVGVGFEAGGGDADAPVVVEEIRVRSDDWRDSATRHIKVVKRGDEVIGVIKPQSNNTSATTPRESEVTGGR